MNEAPELAVLADASFEKARTLKVYSAPSEDAWSPDGAQVTTDDTVAIYGMDGQWVLVSYAIGNGSRGRIGYIDDMTLADDASIPLLAFSSVRIPLTRDAHATDDPLRSRSTITTLKAGDTVTLLAFMDEWAYVETQYSNKTCRLFIPRAALQN